MTPAFLARALERMVTAAPTVADLPGVEFHDRRRQAIQAHGPKRQWATRTRTMRSATGICWHQAAIDLGERPERYDSGGAHVFVTRGGKVIWLHDWDRYVAAANGWSAGTISVEVSGLYAGVEGSTSTTWDNPATAHREQPQDLTPELAATCRDVARWIHADAMQRGARLRVQVAHRQASASRRSDPGQAIWRDVVLPIEAELGLVTAADTVLDDGRAIPKEWDERSTHRY